MENYNEKMKAILNNSVEENIWHDGVLCPDFYFSPENSVKILFLLREAYIDEPLKPTFNFINHLLTESKSKGTHPNIARITQMIYALKNEGSSTWSELSGKETERKESMKKIALINAKKSPNRESKQTDWKTFPAIFEQNGPLLIQQIELCNPDIIICGGVYDLYKKIILGVEDNEHDIEVPNGFRYTNYGGRIAVDSYHPATFGHVFSSKIENTLKQIYQ